MEAEARGAIRFDKTTVNDSVIRMESCPIPSGRLLRAELSSRVVILRGRRQATVLAEMRGTTACGFSPPDKGEMSQGGGANIRP